MDLKEKFKEITSEMNDIFARKNKDYGNSFSSSIDEFGPIAGVVRISDKFNRLKTLINSPDKSEVKDESLIDTLTDMANYCIMLRMELERINNNK